ncbi:MAG: SURF1 family protein [Actinomycetota bacterium]|nr:SURF1 family protein [Actinomycetota bacterium]
MASPAPSDLLRLALTPRFLVRAGLALLLIVAFSMLGRWQWERTQDVLTSERVALAQAVAVDELNPVGAAMTSETVGRSVTAVGTYQPAEQRIVLHRGLSGVTGVWVVTPLELADGSLIAVMRGWLPAADSPGLKPDPGQVHIAGVLQADESFYQGAATTPGEVAAISQRSLNWGPQARAGFIVLASQHPLTQPAPSPVPMEQQSTDVAFPFQNFLYAFQWWVFGLFVVAVYLRWLWLDAQLLNDEELAPPPEPSEPSLD